MIKHTLLLLSALSLLACAKSSGQVIAKIPEASGIAYCSSSDTLIVANDEGRYYEITPQGRIIDKVKLGKYDLEGVVCEEKQIIFVREDKGLLMVDSDTGTKQKVVVDTVYEGKKLSLFDKKEGIEGIAKVGNRLYLSKQSKKKKKSFIAVVKMKPYPSRVVDVIHHHMADTSGLTYHEGYLYMVSDKEDRLIKYDVERKKIVQKIKLEKGAWEGVAFDKKGFVYLADDDGRVVKYKASLLGL